MNAHVLGHASQSLIISQSMRFCTAFKNYDRLLCRHFSMLLSINQVVWEAQKNSQNCFFPPFWLGKIGKIGKILHSIGSTKHITLILWILPLWKCWVGMRPPVVAGDSHPWSSSSCERRARCRPETNNSDANDINTDYFWLWSTSSMFKLGG